MPTVVLRFVNTDADGTGDGTTNNTTGVTGAYANLRAALEAEAADIAGVDVQLDIQCSAPSGVADTVADAGMNNVAWVTDATRFVRVFAKAGEECDGLFRTDRYRLDLAADSLGVAWGGHDFVMEDIALRFQGTTAAARAVESGASGSGKVRLERCVILGHPSGNANTVGLRLRNTGLDLTLVNVIIAKFGSHAMNMVSTASAAVFYGLTVADNGGQGIHTTSTGHIVRNCHSTGNSNDFITTSVTGNNNLASDGDAPGANSLINQTPAFVDAAGGDYHLAAGDPGRGLGVDLSADATYAFSTDIDRGTRSAWDIGADEFGAAAGGAQAASAADGLKLGDSALGAFGGEPTDGIIDDFEDGTIDVGLWSTDFTGTGYTITETGGDLIFTFGTGIGSANIETVDQNLDGTGRVLVQVNIASAVSSDGQWDFTARVLDAGANRVGWWVNDENLMFTQYGTTDNAIGDLADIGPHFRVRHDAGTDDIVWDSSVSGSVWTERQRTGRATTGIAITGLRLRFPLSGWGTPLPAPGSTVNLASVGDVAAPGGMMMLRRRRG